LLHMSRGRRPRLASLAEIGMNAAKNRLPNSWIRRNPSCV